MDFIILILRKIVAIAVVVITVGAFLTGGNIGGMSSFSIGPAIGSGILGLIVSVIIFGVVALLIKIEENTREDTNANVDT